jgi:hypothetical protein
MWLINLLEINVTPEQLKEELEQHKKYLKSLYNLNEQKLGKHGHLFLMRDIDRIISTFCPEDGAKESKEEPLILDMFPFVDEFSE